MPTEILMLVLTGLLSLVVAFLTIAIATGRGHAGGARAR
jgi:hypothetical protein